MSATNEKKKSIFEIANKNFVMLFIAYTVICIAHSMTQATASAGWKSMGMDMSIIGLISGIQGWAAFIIRPFSAPIVDRGNKKIEKMPKRGYKSSLKIRRSRMLKR